MPYTEMYFKKQNHWRDCLMFYMHVAIYCVLEFRMPFVKVGRKTLRNIKHIKIQKKTLAADYLKIHVFLYDKTYFKL